jgi:hypothetical protein
LTISDELRATDLVALAGIPVQRFLELHDHLDALLAELAVIAVPGTPSPASLRPLVSLLDGLTGPFAAVRRLTRQAAVTARDAGKATFELVADLPPSAGALVALWNGLLDAADAASSRGLLLTPPAPPDLVDLRRWIGAEIAARLARD